MSFTFHAVLFHHSNICPRVQIIIILTIFNFFSTLQLKEDKRGKGRGKVHPGTGHEGSEGGVEV